MYKVRGKANKISEGTIETGKVEMSFGVTNESTLPSPADILVSSFAACCLKNVERFSDYMHFEYEEAEISVEATRQAKPPMIDKIDFEIKIKTEDEKINSGLLLRNIQKFGTIYNTLNAVCQIDGIITIEKMC